MDHERDVHPEPASAAPSRRDLLTGASSLAMAGGLAAGYGTFAVLSARYLFPARPRELSWMFVVRVADLAPGSSLTYRAPTGETIAVARQGDSDAVESFVALSSTCPHLGCQVHWEPQHDRFFCPCHNGTFDPAGRGTGGPPGEAGQSLPRYALKIEEGLLYIEVPTEKLSPGAESSGRVVASPPAPPGPGHDPCLYAVRSREA